VKDRLRACFAAVLAALEERQRTHVPICLGAARDHAARGGRIVLIAFGKAARGMATAALGVLPAHRVRGVLVTPEPDAAPLPPLAVVPGGHPLPTSGSFAAAAHALELCHEAGPNDHVVFLVSGGGSALLELPYDRSIRVDEWRRFYRGLVGSGAAIERLNALRRRVSLVKGGRLAIAAQHAAGQTTVLVNDTACGHGDIASGPSVFADPAGADEASRTTWLDDAAYHSEVRNLRLEPSLPARLAADLANGTLPHAPAIPDALWGRCAWLTLLDEHFARAQCTMSLRATGVVVDDFVADDDAGCETAAAAMLQRLAQLRAAKPDGPIAIVSTGELSVPLPADPGIGGRNQQFLLACAARIAGQPITVLSCGTDGVDGNSPAAGGLVDGSTVARASTLGRDVADAMRRCDAFPLLDALGDAIVTGPTGTNVRDVRVVLHHG
jgi:hydroxypyruvate reductase